MGLDTVELIVKVEKTFSISISNKEAEKISTVGDLYNCVWANLTKVNRSEGISREEMENQIPKIIIDHAGMEPHEVHPQAKFTDDLGMD